MNANRFCEMPALVIFFSVPGGIRLFRFPGFITGALVAALFDPVFEIYRHI